MSKDDKLASQLKTLNESIELLTKVITISIGKENIFKGKQELGDKIDALEEFDLPDKIIAWILGSTPESVRSIRYQKKAKLKKAAQPAPKQEEEKK